MNKQIARLYDQALVLETNGDYATGELDPEKFAQLIVRECIATLKQSADQYDPRAQFLITEMAHLADLRLTEHFEISNARNS